MVLLGVPWGVVFADGVVVCDSSAVFDDRVRYGGFDGVPVLELLFGLAFGDDGVVGRRAVWVQMRKSAGDHMVSAAVCGALFGGGADGGIEGGEVLPGGTGFKGFDNVAGAGDFVAQVRRLGEGVLPIVSVGGCADAGCFFVSKARRKAGAARLFAEFHGRMERVFLRVCGGFESKE